MRFVCADEDIHPDVFSYHPSNFSDNEFAAHMVSVLSGCCCIDDDDGRVAKLDFLWPMLGLDSAKMTDPAYAQEVALKFIAKLGAARVELRNQRIAEDPPAPVKHPMSPLAAKLDELLAGDMPLLDVIRQFGEWFVHVGGEIYEHTDAEYAVQNLSCKDLKTEADVPAYLRECWNALVEARVTLRAQRSSHHDPRTDER